MANAAVCHWIGDLPPGIVERILSRLPIRDAARTSILSRAWRYIWNSMPDLNFEYGLCSSADGFGRIVSRCLLLHRGPIHKLSVHSMLRLGPEIDPWIAFLSRHGIEELDFAGRGLEGCRFPSSLFDCKKLTSLKLLFCKLGIPPTFEGFVFLKRLQLHRTEVDSNIERLISRSPSLEILSLELLYFPDLAAIRISAPKVKFLELHGRFKDVYLENLHALVEMEFGLDHTALPSNRSDRSLIEMFDGACNLEKLTLGLSVSKYFKTDYDPSASSTTFNHLKFVDLMPDLQDVDQVLGVLELLLSAPNLENVAIYSVYEDELTEHFPIKLHGVYSDFWLKYPLRRGGFMKLKSIVIDIICVPAEVEFAKFLLCNSPVLEELMVTFHGQKKKAKAIDMFDKLLELPRASAQVEITLNHNGKKL